MHLTIYPTKATLAEAEAAEAAETISAAVSESGRARIIKVSDTGDEIPLNILRAGDSFGELELLDGLASPSTVRASCTSCSNIRLLLIKWRV